MMALNMQGSFLKESLMDDPRREIEPGPGPSKPEIIPAPDPTKPEVDTGEIDHEEINLDPDRKEVEEK